MKSGAKRLGSITVFLCDPDYFRQCVNSFLNMTSGSLSLYVHYILGYKWCGLMALSMRDDI